MGNVFKNEGVAVGTSATDLYTVPSGKQGVIHALFLSNVDGTNNVTATVEVEVASGSFIKIINAVDVPAKSTLVIDKVLNVEAGLKIRCTASAASDLQAFASILEITP